ncbi:MAG: ABC transporter permease [Phycisphaerales bacterium]|nr:ABC transporter permease [Phycisphaerales bacterium]
MSVAESAAGTTPLAADPIDHASGRAAAAVLAWREGVRFRRQPARVVAALGTALMLWVIVGSGLGGSMSIDTHGRYSTYLVPGMMTLVAMFASIFSAIAVIDDRRDGFLQGVLVSPAPRWSIAVGTIAGGAIVAFVQAVVLVPLVWFSGARPGAGDVLLALVALLLTCIALQGVGFAFAWRSRDTASFHSIMNTVLMPLWLLSDAFFPLEGASRWLAAIIAINPLSWCGEAIRHPLSGQSGVGWPLLGATLFAVAALAWSTWSVARPSRLVMGGK